MPLYQPNEIILNGKYKIERLLGAGAFGEVYLATHLDLGVQRAIKVAHRIMPGFASSRFEEAFDRFRQEAQIGARIKSENIIQIHDFENGAESLHLVMEYASGGSLEEKLNEMLTEDKVFSVEDSLKIINKIAAGLATLHDKRNPIVHRDLKPSNILFDAEGQAKIADLGLAQVPGGLSIRTRLGSLAQPHPGTPAYMSPEQEDSCNMLRPTSDIYSLGIVWFEMLSGANYKMQPPGTTIIEFREDLPPEIISLLANMLEKDIEARLWNGKKLVERLENPRNQRKLEEIKINPPQDIGYTENLVISVPPKVIIEKPLEEGPSEPEAESIKKVKINKNVEMEFVYIPPGKFLMGAGKDDNEAKEDEKPQHQVFLNGFWMGKYPVTYMQYSAYCKETKKPLADFEKIANQESCPIANINWFEAVEFCKWLSQISNEEIQLPSEAQWEKAARGTDGRKYPWGGTKSINQILLNNKLYYPVGKYEENQSPYGCYDMVGNVWEWVNDWYDEKYYLLINDTNNPVGPPIGISKILKGGSWDYLGKNLRCSYRSKNYPVVHYRLNGFRCMMVA
jgi:formylglycine-generating enzyme required for sulfatase activity/tRNA A-37 threonylcarbamoyl transferase component Bud32